MKKRLLYPTEEDVQKVIVDGLRLLGYVVLVTTHRLRRCSHCGRWGNPRYGATRGVPDLLVRRPCWAEGAWLGMEVKGPKTRLSAEQADLLAQRALFVVHSLEEAVAVLAGMPAGPW